MKAAILSLVLMFSAGNVLAMESIQRKVEEQYDEDQMALCIDKLETIQKWGNSMKHDYFKFLYQKWAAVCPADLNEKYKLNY